MAPVFAVNAGSSSLKIAAFAGQKPLARARIEWRDGGSDWRIEYGVDCPVVESSTPQADLEKLLAQVLLQLAEKVGSPAAVGHRIVHGGTQYAGPVLVTKAIMSDLAALSPLAPLHQMAGLRPMDVVAGLWPAVAQVACFDTAFHSSLSETARRFAIPRALERQGIRKYGFHGLSYQHVAARLGELAPDLAGARVIVAHLGAGSSLCALCGGKSMETSMGFSPLDGLVMGTRPGTLDAGVLLHLLRQNWSADAIEDMLYHRCGLLGVSDISADMRVLLASQDIRAKEAVDLYVHRLTQQIGAMAASLGGLDGLVFTGGVGENSAAIREMTCNGAAWLGVKLDYSANRCPAGLISSPASRVAVWVIPTDEESVIAGQTLAVINS